MLGDNPNNLQKEEPSQYMDYSVTDASLGGTIYSLQASSVARSRKSSATNEDRRRCTKENEDYRSLVKDANILRTARVIASQIKNSPRVGSEKHGNVAQKT